MKDEKEINTSTEKSNEELEAALDKTEEYAEEELHDELEKLAATFRNELNKAKEQGAVKIGEVAVVDEHNNVIPKEELCECCGERRKDTTVSANYQYCSECRERMKRYPISLVSVFIAVVVTVIAIAKDFFDELIHRDSFRDYLKYQTNPTFQLSEEQYHKIVTILNTLRIIVNSKHHKRHETLANLLDILFYTLTRYRGEENKPGLHESRNSFIIHAFYDLLVNNYKTQHKIDWYGEQLCLTPKYLSSIIKKTTNKSAAAWIDEILILHAKRILHTRRDLTVQQVAYELGFKENATFCRFFKDQTGLRPSEYRKGQ